MAIFSLRLEFPVYKIRVVWCGVAQTKIENVQLLLFDFGNFEWFLRRFSLFANGLVNGGWLVGRSLDMPDCVFMFLLPPQRPSYMFNGVLCIHLYLLLLLLSASQTEQTHPNICTVFRSSLPFCRFSFPLHFILGQYFQFARLQTDSFYFRIYGYWIKSLLLLAINEYHSINIYIYTRNESNETDTNVHATMSFSSLWIVSISIWNWSCLLLGTFHFFAYFTIVVPGVYDVCVCLYVRLFTFNYLYDINELNTMVIQCNRAWSWLGMGMGTHILSIHSLLLICKTFSIRKIFMPEQHFVNNHSHKATTHVSHLFITLLTIQ